MPPTSPPPAQKPGAKGAKGFLTKKYGPFSAWVWLVMVGGSVAIWYMLRRTSDSGGGPVELVTGADGGGGGFATPQDAAGAGSPSQNTAPGSQLDPAVMEQLASIGSDLGGISRAMGTATGSWESAAGEWAGLADEYSDSLYGIYSSQDVAMGGSGAASPTVAATLAPPGKSPAPKGQKQSVTWGGVIYGKGTGATFIADQLRPKGVNPQSWAKKHPEAAAYLGIPKSAPKPPAHAARPAPKQIVQKKKAVAPPKKAPARPVVKAKVAPPKKKPVPKKVKR